MRALAAPVWCVIDRKKTAVPVSSNYTERKKNTIRYYYLHLSVNHIWREGGDTGSLACGNLRFRQVFFIDSMCVYVVCVRTRRVFNFISSPASITAAIYNSDDYYYYFRYYEITRRSGA